VIPLDQITQNGTKKESEPLLSDLAAVTTTMSHETNALFLPTIPPTEKTIKDDEEALRLEKEGRAINIISSNENNTAELKLDGKSKTDKILTDKLSEPINFVTTEKTVVNDKKHMIDDLTDVSIDDDEEEIGTDFHNKNEKYISKNKYKFEKMQKEKASSEQQETVAGKIHRSKLIHFNKGLTRHARVE
jgi:hypothetical protein